MVNTKQRNKRQNDWQKENAERISFIMPLGTKEKIKKTAFLLNISAAEFIRQAINEKMENIPKV